MCKEELHKLRAYKIKIEEKYGVVEKVTANNPNIIILGLERNKRKTLKLVGFDKDTVYLFDSDHYLESVPYKIFVKFCCDSNIKKPYICIIDVQIEGNQGDGSIAMRGLIRLAKQMQCSKITGKYSTSDDGHSARRDHFYKKFGFEINGDSILLVSEKFEDAISLKEGIKT